MINKKTYKGIDAARKTIEIIEFLYEQTTPVTAAEISRATEIKPGTVMEYLFELEKARWIAIVGGRYEPGVRLTGLHAAFLQGLYDKKAAVEKAIQIAEGGNDK